MPLAIHSILRIITYRIGLGRALWFEVTLNTQDQPTPAFALWSGERVNREGDELYP
jgi:hypothetical protein